MKLSQFNFDLPQDRIAKEPTRWRDECKLLVLHKDTGEIEHRLFKDIIEYFGKGDMFVLNDTKVFPARLYGKKEKTGADIMVFLLRELNREQKLWDVIVDPGRKIRIGNKLYFGDDDSLVYLSVDIHRKYNEKGIFNELRVHNGAHTWEYWHMCLRDALPFATRCFDK